MTSSCETLSEVSRKVLVSVPVESVTKKMSEVLSSYSKHARIKGFREGKAPRDMILKVYGDRIKAEVEGELIQSGLREAQEQHSFDVVGSPIITVTSSGDGKPFEFTAEVSVYPTPTVIGFEKVEVEVPKREVTGAQVDEVISRLRKERATLKPLEGRTELQEGDVAKVEFVVKDEGREPSKPEPYSFCLGEKQVPEEVEKAFAGMSIGETRDASVTREGATPIVYQGKLLSLSERILPELNDNFAVLVDPETKTVAELNEKIRTLLDEEAEKIRSAEIENAIIEKVVSQNQFPVPQIMIDDEILGMLRSRGMLGEAAPSDDILEMFRKELGESALKRLRGAICIDRIAQQLSLKLDDNELKETIQAYAQRTQNLPAKKRGEVMTRERISGLMIETMRKKVLDHLRKESVVKFIEAKEAK